MIWGGLTAKVRGWLIGAGSVLVALAAAYFNGKRDADAAAERERLEGYVETRKRMDEVGRMSDADAARDFLSDRLRGRNK